MHNTNTMSILWTEQQHAGIENTLHTQSLFFKLECLRKLKTSTCRKIPINWSLRIKTVKHFVTGFGYLNNGLICIYMYISSLNARLQNFSLYHSPWLLICHHFVGLLHHDQLILLTNNWRETYSRIVSAASCFIGLDSNHLNCNGRSLFNTFGYTFSSRQ